jgi:RNA polymerase sigma-70 factor (ECF subfamily)
VLDLADRGLDRAFRLAGLILGDHAEAEDATQDALVRAWRATTTLRDPAGFDAWFDRILINVCRDRLRRRGKVRVLTLDGEAGTVFVDDPFRNVYADDELLVAMRALGDDERLVLILHFWADLTLAAVAARLDCPVGTVKSRLHRGLKTMREQLDTSGWTGGFDD